MKMYDIITKKKHGEALTKEEIEFFVSGYTAGDIPDYQASALTMAICLCGMNDEETRDLTMAMARSGDMIDLSEFGELTVDKHSTGGVGDKTTLIVAPIVASLGAKVAKMSGRGLGHTGGTVDKLESFPGYDVALSPEKFAEQVRKIGIAVIGQSGNLAPADKKLYALRDVTATVDSIPLITSSIMSKKLAAGTKSIVLDVKCGSGAFMSTPEDAKALAENMVRIGRASGRRVSALITDMDRPLGHAVGNELEVIEAIEVLSGGGPEDLRDVCLALATEMTALSLNLSHDKAREKCKDAIKSGLALAKFKEWIATQGGDASYASDTSLFKPTKLCREIVASSDGYVTSMNTERIGSVAVTLGAGRLTKEDAIDYSAGLIIHKKTGDFVTRGELIATLYTNKESSLDAAEKSYLDAVKIEGEKPSPKPTIFSIVRE